MKPILLTALLAATTTVAEADRSTLKIGPAGPGLSASRLSARILPLAPQPPPGVRAIAGSGVRYGRIRLGPSAAPMAFAVALLESPDKPPRILVDTNGDGNLSDYTPLTARAATYTSAGKSYVRYQVRAELRVNYGANARVLGFLLTRHDPGDDAVKQYRGGLALQPDYAATGALRVGNETFQAALVDASGSGDFSVPTNSVFLLIDKSRDGRFDNAFESFDVTEPFNVSGVTYEVKSLSADGTVIDIVPSDQRVEETVNPMALRVGAQALPFEAQSLDKKAVRVPGDFKANLLLVEFWSLEMRGASEWCAETSALAKRHRAAGLAVLGVNMDGPGREGAIRAFCKANEMDWPVLYDGQGADAEPAQLMGGLKAPYRVLIDGGKSTIVAHGAALGAGLLDAAVAKQLKAWKTPKPAAP